MTTVDKKRGPSGITSQANPAFAIGAVVIPIAALGFSLTVGNLRALFYVHIMAGALWTGVDVFMGAVLGPVLGSLSPKERANVCKKFTPKMTFLMPALAAVTITAGIQLAKGFGYWDLSYHWLLAALGIATLLSIIGFGIILPGEVKIYREIVSETPDVNTISRIGMRNAKLGGVQGLLQLLIIFVMANLRL
ncbi:DUF4149 domain-containing protein [Haladaptatus sp. NG-SE-30]